MQAMVPAGYERLNMNRGEGIKKDAAGRLHL